MCESSAERRVAQVVFALAVVASVFVGVVTPAWATLDSDPVGKTWTNPGGVVDPTTRWRDGWGNSPFPALTFTSVPSDMVTMTVDGTPTPVPFAATGFAYRVTRAPGSLIDTTLPNPFADPLNHWSPIPAGPTFTSIFDLKGIYATPGASFGPAIEGPWWYMVVFKNEFRYATRQWGVDDFTGDSVGYFMGYDATKPTMVSYLSAGSTAWQQVERRKIVFGTATDPVPSGVTAVSGVARYIVTVTNAKTGTRSFIADPGIGTATVEDLGPGKNTISIQAQDRATNIGPARSVESWVDTDTPRIKMTAPTSSTVGWTTTFSAIASDYAGVARVKFFIDGHPVMTRTKTPYSFSYSTGSLGAGWHTIAAEATDMFGHRATASKSFKVDLTLPRISVSSVAPNPFYPRLVDGYKDYSITSFYLAKPAYVRFSVYRSNGTWAWGYQKSLGAGYRSIAWNGRNSSGTVMPEGTYYYRISATDAVGNTYTTGRYSSTIRYYIIVRLAANKAKVVAH
jgi:hypothetical protein